MAIEQPEPIQADQELGRIPSEQDIREYIVVLHRYWKDTGSIPALLQAVGRDQIVGDMATGTTFFKILITEYKPLLAALRCPEDEEDEDSDSGPLQIDHDHQASPGKQKVGKTHSEHTRSYQ